MGLAPRKRAAAPHAVIVEYFIVDSLFFRLRNARWTRRALFSFHQIAGAPTAPENSLPASRLPISPLAE
jgi:hypothetical protein